METLIRAVAQAIAAFEGFFKAGTVAARNNNPGNLRAGPRAVSKDAQGYAVYATADDGWADLYRQVDLNISRGLNLREFFAGKPGVYPGYAPAEDANQPENYAQFVATRVGVPVDQPLLSLAAPSVSPQLPGLETGSADYVLAAALALAGAAIVVLFA